MAMAMAMAMAIHLLIATVLGRSRTTIYTELKHGSVIQIRQGKARLVYLAQGN